VPLNADGLIKFNCDPSFTRMTEFEDSKWPISVPLDVPVENQWTPANVPPRLKALARRILKNTYGKHAAGIEPAAYRICWDCCTPSQDFLISAHLRCANLYIGSGGGFHAWKMLPILGTYVVKVLQGNLSGEEARRWAWGRYDFDGNDSFALGNESATSSGYQPPMDWVDLQP